MSLRLVHSVMFGKTWYGQWGYHYHRGSYNVTKTMWKNAIALLQSLTIAELYSALDVYNYNNNNNNRAKNHNKDTENNDHNNNTNGAQGGGILMKKKSVESLKMKLGKVIYRYLSSKTKSKTKQEDGEEAKSNNNNNKDTYTQQASKLVNSTLSSSSVLVKRLRSEVSTNTSGNTDNDASLLKSVLTSHGNSVTVCSMLRDMFELRRRELAVAHNGLQNSNNNNNNNNDINKVSLSSEELLINNNTNKSSREAHRVEENGNKNDIPIPTSVPTNTTINYDNNNNNNNNNNSKDTKQRLDPIKIATGETMKKSDIRHYLTSSSLPPQLINVEKRDNNNNNNNPERRTKEPKTKSEDSVTTATNNYTASLATNPNNNNNTSATNPALPIKTSGNNNNNANIDKDDLEHFQVASLKSCRWQTRRVLFAMDAVIMRLLNTKRWLARQGTQLLLLSLVASLLY